MTKIARISALTIALGIGAATAGASIRDMAAETFHPENRTHATPQMQEAFPDLF